MSNDTNIPITALEDGYLSSLSFEDFWTNDDLFRANDKQRYILAASHGMVDDFSL